MLDISPDGLALVATNRYEVGQVKSLTMLVGDDELEGTVTVCNVYARKGGGFRYGLHCNEDRKSFENLNQTIRQLWVNLQIAYLETLPD